MHGKRSSGKDGMRFSCRGAESRPLRRQVARPGFPGMTRPAAGWHGARGIARPGPPVCRLVFPGRAPEGARPGPAGSAERITIRVGIVRPPARFLFFGAHARRGVVVGSLRHSGERVSKHSRSWVSARSLPNLFRVPGRCDGAVRVPGRPSLALSAACWHCRDRRQGRDDSVCASCHPGLRGRPRS